MSPEQLADVLDCCNAQENWQAMVRHWKHRAAMAMESARTLRADALDAMERATEHEDDARNFEGLAWALENASVTFPVSASAIEAGTAETGTGSVHESAVAKPDAHTQDENPHG